MSYIVLHQRKNNISHRPLTQGKGEEAAVCVAFLQKSLNEFDKPDQRRLEGQQKKIIEKNEMVTYGFFWERSSKKLVMWLRNSSRRTQGTRFSYIQVFVNTTDLFILRGCCHYDQVIVTFR